jgi:acetate kinase
MSVPASRPLLLTLNGGSSSIKFALYTADTLTSILSGQIERIGSPHTRLVAAAANSPAQTIPLDAPDHPAAAAHLIAFLRPQLHALAAIGHRVVHGGLHLLDHQPLTPELLAEFRRNIPLDLTHLPREIALIEAFRTAFPALPQFACFDTAFFKDLPLVAQQLPIPREFLDAGIRRFGFHGLSYTYLLSRFQQLHPEKAGGKIIFAHLGSGASMAAVNRGKPLDTTMAFTPTAGLMMATRPGDLDPGLLIYLQRVKGFSPDDLDTFISERCGLRGVSGSSADTRDLAAAAPTDPRAAQALELFCYTARKFIGSLAATLNGLDTLIFSAGIGEHAPGIRAAICQDLDYLGLSLDLAANAENAATLSTAQSRVAVYVIPTDEEAVIARLTAELLKQGRS